jgi:hypothetical protein
MTISKITLGSRKTPYTGYQATQIYSGRIITSIAVTRMKAITELLKALKNYCPDCIEFHRFDELCPDNIPY